MESYRKRKRVLQNAIQILFVLLTLMLSIIWLVWIFKAFDFGLMVWLAILIITAIFLNIIVKVLLKETYSLFVPYAIMSAVVGVFAITPIINTVRYSSGFLSSQYEFNRLIDNFNFMNIYYFITSSMVFVILHVLALAAGIYSLVLVRKLNSNGSSRPAADIPSV